MPSPIQKCISLHADVDLAWQVGWTRHSRSMIGNQRSEALAVVKITLDDFIAGREWLTDGEGSGKIIQTSSRGVVRLHSTSSETVSDFGQRVRVLAE